MKTIYFSIPIFFLFVCCLIALTVMISEYHKANFAMNDPKIWCWNDFYCQKVCSGNVTVNGLTYNTNSVFSKDWSGGTGMPDALYGLASELNTNCVKGDGEGCTQCPDNFSKSNVQNCFKGCSNTKPSGTTNSYCNPKLSNS